MKVVITPAEHLGTIDSTINKLDILLTEDELKNVLMGKQSSICIGGNRIIPDQIVSVRMQE